MKSIERQYQDEIDDLREGREKLDAEFEKLSATALRVKEERDALLEEARNAAANLETILDLIDGYVDVEYGDYGQPRANNAMRAKQAAEQSHDALQKIIAKVDGR